MTPAAPDSRIRFNPPPSWSAPAGFDPRRGHLPDPAWPAAPEGWSFWVTDPTTGRETAPLPSATLPRGRLESGERRRLVIALAGVAVATGVIVWVASATDEPVDTPGIGSCWTEGTDWVTEVPCSSSRAVYIVQQEATTADQCPPSEAGYLEVDDTVLCLRPLD